MTLKTWPARKIALGGMAEVFLAQQQGLAGFERLVVVKRILRSLQQDARFVQMFLDEARLAAQLRHPNIAEIYDIVREDGDFFIVMEYLSGEDLRIVMGGARSKNTALPIEVSCRIVADVAAALDHAHQATDLDGNPLNIVHRDVGPSNIIVTYAGVTKLVDFGVAKANTHHIYTKPGTLKGKLAYSSPEEVQHQELDARSDVFSLGIVLHELLTLRRLFKGENPAGVIKAVMEQPILPPSRFNEAVWPELDAVVMHALARDPRARTQSAVAFLQELEHAVDVAGMSVGTDAVAGWMGVVLQEQYERRTYFEQNIAETGHGVTSITDASAERASLLPSYADGSGLSLPGLAAVEEEDEEGGMGRGLVIALVALLALGGIGVAFWFGLQGGEPEQAPVAGGRIGLVVHVEPTGALLSVDGEQVEGQVGPNGLFVPTDPGARVRLEITRDGYHSRGEDVSGPQAGVKELYFALVEQSLPDEPAPVVVVNEPTPQKAPRATPRAPPSPRAGGGARGRAAPRSAAATTPPTPSYATLIVRHEPVDATLTLDGSTVSGQSPRRIGNLSPGRHVLRLDAPGRTAITRTVELDAGQSQEIILEMSTAAPTLARLDIVTSPSGAQILVDGRPRGTSPLVGLTLPPDREHSIVAQLEGYSTWRTTVTPSAGDNPPLVVNLRGSEPQAALMPAPTRSDVRVPSSMTGSAGSGRGLYASGCGSCHGRTASAISPRRYTAAQWSRYFSTGRHARRAELRPHFTQRQLADVKAFVQANAADVESATAAGVR